MMGKNVIYVSTGTILVFDKANRQLWSALETSGTTIEALTKSNESFIVASSVDDIDKYMAALEKAKAFFTQDAE